MTTRTLNLTLAGAGPLDVTVDDRGEGRPFLLLHGGGGPQTVAGFAELLATHVPARVITPSHPGFGGTPRPDGLTSIAGLAALYRELLDRLGLDDVTVIGNSIGGWIAAELALLGSPRISGLVLADAVGIEVDGHPVTDIFPLSLDELARLSYHDPAAFRIDPAAMTEAQRAVMATNRAALQVYGGARMADPALRGRLAAIACPRSSSGARPIGSPIRTTAAPTPPRSPAPGSSCCPAPATCRSSRPPSSSCGQYGTSPRLPPLASAQEPGPSASRE